MTLIASLAALKDGENGVLTEFLDNKIACKLMSMGILPGKDIALIRRVPFGGGLYVKVAGQNFAIREEEARSMLVDKTTENALI
jgi:ferrous iron transport protein A